MKQALAALIVAGMLVGAPGRQAEAGDREWAVAGKVLTGLIVLDAVTSPYRAPTVVYQRPAVYYAPPVVYPQPSVVYQPPVVYGPTVVYRQPTVYYPPVYYGPTVYFSIGRSWRPYYRGGYHPYRVRYHGHRRSHHRRH